MEITRTIHHAIAPSSKKRLLNNGLSSTHDSIHTGVIGSFHIHLAHQIRGANASSPLFPEGQPVKWLKHQIHGAKQEKLYPQEEGSQYKYKLKNPRRASVCAETRTYGTDSPSRWKSRALSITLLHHPQKKDGSITHMIPSTRESSEDVIYTYT